MKKTLRLICTYRCPRNCEGCCNTQDAYLQSSVPTFNIMTNDFSRYEEVILTGGEPLINFGKLKYLIEIIRDDNPDANIIVYTSNVHMKDEIIELLYLVDGITCTIHDQKDVDDFRRLNFWLLRLKRYKMDNNKTLRLNVVEGVDVYMQDDSLWKIKDNIKMIDNCPVPQNEVLMKLYPQIWDIKY